MKKLRKSLHLKKRDQQEDKHSSDENEDAAAAAAVPSMSERKHMLAVKAHKVF
jgi:hypothetical protein